MDNQNEKLLSWKEAIRYNIKAIALLNKRYPKMMLSRVLWTGWNSLSPYVTIYLSALLIDKIAASDEPKNIIILAVVTLLSNVLISLVSALLMRWKNNLNDGAWLKVTHIFTDKLLHMDFCDIDDIEVHKKHSTIEQNHQGGGWGLFETMWSYELLIAAVLSLGGGIALSVSLFTRKVPVSGGRLSVLNHPFVNFGIIVLMSGITYLSPMLENRITKRWAQFANLHNLGNRLFFAYGYMGRNAEHAADIRMYRQDLLGTKYLRNTANPFGSKGVMAKQAMGHNGLCHAASGAISVVFTGVVYLYVCLKAWAGAFGVGAVTQYVSAVTSLSGGVSSLMEMLGEMRTNASFLKSVFELLDSPNAMQKGDVPVPKCKYDEYEIEFQNVSFRYPGSEVYALRNVSVKLNAGQKLAMVGENGSGKTTFIKLLCRLYDPTEGIIFLNGRDIREYDYEEYLKVFSVVFQDFKLFAFLLGQNVAAQESYSEEFAEKCLEKAGFSERLKTMPDGLNTYLYKEFDKNGVGVSGGEAQKIAIARTLYKDSPFILLDEPTAALDPLAEAEIYEKFNDMVEDKTAIYISHRLSSCRFCDDIMVFHEGEVVQRGSHEMLLEHADGKYAQLWNAQAQYYA